MMLSPESFTQKYGHGDPISCITASSRKIYKGKDFIVKSGTFHEMLIELSCYATYKHPGIVELYAWTLGEDGKLKLALESGIPLNQDSQLQSSELGILISNLISVCSFLHTASLPLVHGDIKPENIVAINNRYKIIDFGNAMNGYVDAGEIHYQGFAYTESYRAAEYDPTIPHTSIVESFSIGKTIDILACKTALDPEVRKFIEKTTKDSPDERVEIRNLLAPVDRRGLCFPPLYTSAMYVNTQSSRILWYKCVGELIHQSKIVPIWLRTFFLALSNARRSFSVIIQSPENYKLYSMAHLAIALSIIQGDALPAKLESQASNPISASYREILRSILSYLKSQVYVTTYWDVVDHQTLNYGLIRQLNYTRHKWDPSGVTVSSSRTLSNSKVESGNLSHRVYGQLQPHIVRLSEHYMNLQDPELHQLLCEMSKLGT
jgi:serine/threonine protein kinase